MDSKYQRQGKDTKARNDINDRLNNLHINHYIEKPKNDLHDNVNKNFKESLKKENFIDNSFTGFDRSDFKNDINSRLNNLNGMESPFMKRIPLNNNIRDYEVTVDSKRDIFNERLANYNQLASNTKAPVEEEINLSNSQFHKSFREDSNKRLENFSPLSRNMGLPIFKKQDDKKIKNNIQRGFLENESPYDGYGAYNSDNVENYFTYEESPNNKSNQNGFYSSDNITNYSNMYNSSKSGNRNINRNDNRNINDNINKISGLNFQNMLPEDSNQKYDYKKY